MSACGSPHETNLYDSPLTNSASGSGGVGGSGGGAGRDASGGSGTGNAAGSSAESGGSAGRASGGNGASGSGGNGAESGSLGVGGELVAGEGGMGGAQGGEGGEGPSVDCSPHGDDAVGFDGHCYAYDSGKVTWQAAVDACQARDAHLVSISSEARTVAEFLAENAFVWKLTASTPTWLAATDGKGPHQKGDGTFFEWITGESMTLDNWSAGQPNTTKTSCEDGDPCDCTGDCYEHCGFQWEQAGRLMEAVPGWNDRLCVHHLGFVCEWEG